jgi:deazaflavin-dependent oxidoreductase (nitroreductase family)
VGYTNLLRRLGDRAWFAAAGRRAVPLDRFLAWVTRGRFIGYGLPCLLLTTTGRKSGLPRTQPLLYARDGDGYVVTASNWGQHNHPAWSMNLLHDPGAVIKVKGRRLAVHAVLADGTERDRLWRLAVREWPGYEAYADRSGRDIRVFRLEPAT